MRKGASVPDQALAVPVEPVARLDPSGFDPSRWHDLISRNERADRPDPELFEEAFRLCFPKPAKIWAVDYVEWTAEYTEWQARQSAYYELIEAEAFVDAALSLVRPDPFSCRALNITLERDDDTWGADVWHPLESRPNFSKLFCFAHAALLDAVLRANLASAIEARSGETTQIGSTEGESATAKPGRPNTITDTPQ
jgi:hypothetical protein